MTITLSSMSIRLFFFLLPQTSSVEMPVPSRKIWIEISVLPLINSYPVPTTFIYVVFMQPLLSINRIMVAIQ